MDFYELLNLNRRFHLTNRIHILTAIGKIISEVSIEHQHHTVVLSSTIGLVPQQSPDLNI